MSSPSYSWWRVEQLTRSTDPPTLGRIVAQWNGDMDDFLSFHARQHVWVTNDERQAQWADGWSRLDDAFRSRPDYRAWREETYSRANRENSRAGDGAVSAVPPPWIKQGQTDSVAQMIVALSDGQPLVVWGGVVVATKFLNNVVAEEAQPRVPDEQVKNLVTILRRRIGDIEELYHAQKGCKVVKMFAISAMEQYRHFTANGKVVGQNELFRFLTSLRSLLSAIDPTWRPGTSLSLRAIEGERRVWPYSWDMVDEAFANVFYQLRTVASLYYSYRAGKNGGNEFEPLLHDAYEYARSAWLTARSNRIGYESQAMRLRENGNEPRGLYSDDSIYCARMKEARALWQCACAARDDWRFVESAILSHYLLHMLPEALGKAQDQWAKKLASDVSGAIKNLGYEVPTRYTSGRARTDDTGARNNQQSDCGPQPFTPAVVTNMAPSAFALRLRQAQESDVWKQVLAAFPNSSLAPRPEDVLRNVTYEAVGGRVTDQRILRCALELCVEFGQIRNAGYLLDTLSPVSVDDLLCFSRGVDVAARACPAAIYVKRHRNWRVQIKRLWAGLAEGLANADTVFLHSASLGICTTAVRGSGITEAFAKKYYQTISAEEFADLLEQRASYFKPGRASPEPQDIAGAFKTLGQRWHKTPVGVSLVVLGENKVSLAAVSASGHVECSSLDTPDIAKHGRQLLKLCDPRDGTLQLRGFPTLGALGKKIFDLAAKVDPKAEWMILAADPEIASLPWNLISRQFAMAGRTPLVVSVVPSLGWVTMVAHSERRQENGSGEVSPEFFLSDEPHLVGNSKNRARITLQNLLARMQEDRVRLQQVRSSTAFVLGHGTLDAANEYYTVVAPDKGIEVNDWIKAIGQFRVVIVHACLCGRVKNGFVGDLAGIPGMLLMRKTRLCCSPVVEVFPQTAIRLQEHLVDTKTMSATVLDRYRMALKEDPTVGFYNLYGLDAEAPPLPQG